MNSNLDKENKNLYVCSKCGKPAEIKDNVVIRECEHKDDSVIANINATCKGIGVSS